MRSLRHFAAFALVVCACTACASSVTGKDGRQELLGALIEGGVECPLFQTDDGKRYTLLGDLKGLKNGDRVRLTGEVVEASFCMQGQTLSVKSIERVK